MRSSTATWFILILTASAIASFLPPVTAESQQSACLELIADEDATIDNCAPAETSLAASIDGLSHLDPKCPPPTSSRRGQCVLESDLQLTSTLDLASFTKLNCQGHTVNPTTPGTETTRSRPEVAILVNNAHGIALQNCSIDGFDFGIVIVNAKVPENLRKDPGTLALLRNKILSNQLRSRYTAVQLLNADNNEIKDNDITFSSGSGRAVAIFSDSDLNRIKNNKITGNANPPDDIVIAPGSQPLTGLRHAEAIITSSLAIFPLINLRIDDTLLQFPWNGLPTGPDDNRVEGNQIDMKVVDPIVLHTGIILGDLDQAGAARQNTVLGGGVGIGVGAFSPGRRILPGVCSSDPSRRSLSDADCYIPGVDSETKGVAVGVSTLSFVDTRSRNNLVQDNNLTGQSMDGIQLYRTYNTHVQGNIIMSAGRTGVLLADRALETATLSRNIITMNQLGLFLRQSPASETFGARVYLNDITESATRAIGLLTGYTLPTELSDGGRGNYWGHTCSEGGFLTSDTPDYTLVKDSHPYGVTVARTSDGQLPTTCK